MVHSYSLTQNLTQNRFLELRSQWVTVFGEHIQNAEGQTEEYWRVEKADSAIILPIHENHVILPPPTYRPGVEAKTWDFPGGRIPEHQSLDTVLPNILNRELGVEDKNLEFIPLNPTGWPVNSSFSNQCLYGFVVHLPPETEITSDFVGHRVPLTRWGIQDLLKRLVCLQCRAVLLEWWFLNGGG
ncbi:MAG: NUDIX hydrolase [Leptolyngbyaceae bacterium]|nr:NUDIX hydrolase [Leptolyngbyaceae bacterium]